MPERKGGQQGNAAVEHIELAAMRKPAMLNRAGKLDDLRVPPRNQ